MENNTLYHQISTILQKDENPRHPIADAIRDAAKAICLVLLWGAK